jgi:uncharacterized repeat protein (TIGR03803 family)
VYKLSPPSATSGTWIESLIYTFSGARDGTNPIGCVIVNAAERTLDGTTTLGGAEPCDCGIVYSLKSPAVAGGNWNETILHSFAGGTADGSLPKTLVASKNGLLYRTTSEGGANNLGTVYAVTP